MTRLEKLLRLFEDKIEDSKTLEEEIKWRLLQSGACAALGAMHMDERKKLKKK